MMSLRKALGFAVVLVTVRGESVVAQDGAESGASPAPSEPVPRAPPPDASSTARASEEVRPFGDNLFGGHFAAQREDGINADYRVLPGDRVVVNAWGVVIINDVFAVDSQGNIFLPGIGPVHLGGSAPSELSDRVRAAIGRVYRGRYEVYTNLLTASPVAVFVTGGVVRPGRYAGIPSDSVLFFLDRAGGIDAGTGSYRNVQILRQAQTIATLDLYDFLVRGTLPNPQLADGDTILVGRRGPSVQARGALARSVWLEFIQQEFTGSDLLAIVSPDAGVNEITLQGNRGGRPVLRAFGLEQFRGEALRNGDVVTLRADHRPDHIIVHLEGEFQGPSVLTVRRGARLLDVLNYVPVDRELSNVLGTHIKRRRVAEEQRRTISDSLDRLERSAMLALSDTQGEANIRVREAELVRQFVERARTVQPLGRVVTGSNGRQMNVVLEDEDTVVIPGRTNVVRVSGEVNVTQALMYEPDLTVWDYVERAGGYTDRADVSRVLLFSQSAEVRIGDPGAPVKPGDEILVLPKVDTKLFQNALDLSTIIYQIAVAASVLVGL